jgi:Tfp pilus assembly protein PilX
MRGYPRQRGSLMIVTIVMILVLGFLGVAITTLSVTSTHNAVDELAAGEAFILAESGLERGIKQWSLNPSTYAGEGPVSFGNGSFTIAPPTLLSATQAHIVSSAAVASVGGSVIRTVEAVVDLGGTLFSDPMSNLTSWPTEDISPNQGNHGFAGGGIRIRTDNTNNAAYTGYLETGTSPALISLSAGQTIQIDLEYKKRWSGGGANPASMDMALELVDTTGANYGPFWFENTPFSNNTWLTAPTANWTVPGGVTINRIRLTFDLQRDGNGRRPQVFFRNITISSASGGTSMLSWQENIP